VLARVLGPDNYGVWSVLTLVLVWSQFADVGLASAVNRQLPVSRAEGDVHGASRAKALGFGLKLGATGIAAIATLVAAALTRNPVYREGLSVVAVLAVLQAIQQFGSVVLLAERRVATAGRLVVTFAVLNFVATLGGAFMAGLRGVWYGLGVALAVTAVLYVRAISVRPSLRMRWPELRSMVVVGMPLAALALISYNLVNVDQLVVAGALGGRELAYYTIALTIGGLLYIAPSSLASIIGPPLIEKWRRGDEGVEDLAWEPVRFLRDSYWLPTVLAMLVVGPAVRWLLPQYQPGIQPALFYLPGAYLLGMNLGASTYLLALGRHWANIPLALASVGVSVCLELLFVRLGMGLSGVALGSTCGYLVYTFSHLTVVRANMGDRIPAASFKAAKMLLPALAWALLMLSGTVLNRTTWLIAIIVFGFAYVWILVVPHSKIYFRLLGVAR